MKIALFGASGMIGTRVAAEAKQRGHTVTALRSSDVDARDAAAVAKAVKGHDIVVSALGPKHGTDAPAMLVDVARGLIEGTKRAEVKRLLVVGGAGSLEVSPGVRLVDAPSFPNEWRPVALAHADSLAVYRGVADLAWTYLSPAALIEPGARTGKYRVGGDQLVVDDKGNSKISAEDFAVALVDEIENAKHTQQRFTVAY